MNSLQQNTRLSALSHREAKACSTEIWCEYGPSRKPLASGGHPGAGIGCPACYGAAFGTTRVIADLLVGVNPADPKTYLLVGLAVMLVAVAVCYVPAKRATRIDALARIIREGEEI